MEAGDVIDWRQYLLLAISLFVPAFCLTTNRHRALTAWICVTFFVQIFDTSIFTNQYAGRLVGLMYLPSALATAGRWSRSPVAQLHLLQLCYVLLLGIVFGLIWPWADTTMCRPWALTAPGRTILYSIRMLSDLSLSVYLFNKLRQPADVFYLGRWLTIGASLTSAAGLLETATGYDFFFGITGLREYCVGEWRSRGLSFEPRGQGFAAAHGLLILLMGQGRVAKSWPMLIALNLLGLLTTVSTSAMVMFLVGGLLCVLFLQWRTRMLVLGSGATLALMMLAGAAMSPEAYNFAITQMELRLDSSTRLDRRIVASNLAEAVAYRLEVFDAAAALFMIAEPMYAVVGCGPGLVSLPASDHIPPGLYTEIWTRETGINSPPLHGFMLEWTNSGLPGLILWCTAMLTGIFALKRRSGRTATAADAAGWRFGYSFCAVATVLYCFQVSVSPFAAVIYAVAWYGSLEPVPSPIRSYRSREAIAPRVIRKVM